MMMFIGNNVVADSSQNYCDLHYEEAVESCMQSFYEEMDDFRNIVEGARLVSGFNADDYITNLCLQKITETDFGCDFCSNRDKIIVFLCRDLCIYRIMWEDYYTMYHRGFPEITRNLLCVQLDDIKSIFCECVNEASDGLVRHFLMDYDEVRTLVVGSLG